VKCCAGQACAKACRDGNRSRGRMLADRDCVKCSAPGCGKRACRNVTCLAALAAHFRAEHVKSPFAMWTEREIDSAAAAVRLVFGCGVQEVAAAQVNLQSISKLPDGVDQDSEHPICQRCHVVVGPVCFHAANQQLCWPCARLLDAEVAVDGGRAVRLWTSGCVDGNILVHRA